MHVNALLVTVLACRRSRQCLHAGGWRGLRGCLRGRNVERAHLAGADGHGRREWHEAALALPARRVRAGTDGDEVAPEKLRPPGPLRTLQQRRMTLRLAGRRDANLAEVAAD